MAIALGVDIGTTAVKCALVETTTRALAASANEDTGEYVDSGVGRAEQRVDAILRAVQVALSKLPQEMLHKVSSVGICGQMHGIVWWRAADVVKDAGAVLAGRGVDRPAWSRLVTWEDQRCSPDFLDECRKRMEATPGDSAPSLSGLASGYGLATFAHTLETNPASLDGYDACGTIHDLLAFILCGHTSFKDVTIDTTDACSWGGFDLDSKNWNLTSVAALGIPPEMLPQVKAPGSIIGQVSTTCPFGIPAGVSVFVPMGDHPCSVVAAIIQHEYQTDSSHGLTLVNFGTSAQLAMILPRHATGTLTTSPSRGFEIRPFITDNQVLGVAAALSGGNMFAWLVRRCQEWMADLTGDTSATPPTKEDTASMYARLIELGLEKVETDLVFSPTLNGERATPDASGCIDALGLHNGSLGDLSASLCRGLVRNLVEMVPQDLHGRLRSSRIIGTGTALLRNALLQHFLLHELDDAANLRLQDATDAAVGAALVTVGVTLS